MQEAALFVVVALTAAFSAYVLYNRKVPEQPRDNLVFSLPRFNTPFALADIRALTDRCPARITGSAGARCASDFIENRLKGFGLSTRTQTFPMWLAGTRVKGRNVFAVLNGTSRKSVVVVAHYDAATTSPDAAGDNASGVATLLELVRIFRNKPLDRTLIFLATDAGEWGMIGARRFAADRAWKAILGSEAPTPFAAISLDHVASGPALGIDLSGGGQFSGFAPLWLRAKAASGIRAAGIRVFPQRPFQQILARAIPVPFSDQGPFLLHGIPALNLSTHPARPDDALRILHTPADRAGELQPGALRLFGMAAESALQAVMSAGITSSPDVVTISATRVVQRVNFRAISALLFIPLLALAIRALLLRRVGPRSIGALSMWCLPVVAAALTLRWTAAVNFLPRYELYPASLKDPFLKTWALLPMILTLLAAFLAAWLARRTSRHIREEGRESALVLLSVATIWAWTRNDFAAALFLAPAAWLWPWIRTVQGRRGRVVDVTLLLMGAAPLAALLVKAGKSLFLGPWIIWYGALQAAYGVFSLHVAAIAGLAAASAIGFSLHSRAEPPIEAMEDKA